MKPENVELHIEELVLRGFAPGDRYRIGAAMERKLTSMFVERSTPASLTQEHEVARLDGGTFEVEPGSGAETIGTQLAQAVHGGLSR